MWKACLMKTFKPLLLLLCTLCCLFSAAQYKVNISITDIENSPVANATVSINQKKIKADSAGKLSVDLIKEIMFLLLLL